MGFLERAIKDGISKGISQAVGGAIKQAVEPKVTEYANKVADELGQAAQTTASELSQAAQSAAGELNQATQASAGEISMAAQSAGMGAQETVSAAGGLEGALAGLKNSMEIFATQAAMSTKICPSCQNPASADKKFCPICGAKLPDETLAQGSVCPNCGKQNAIGTRFCQDCGTKLPFVIAEEKAAAEKNAAVLAKWAELLPEYPVWNIGGSDFELEQLEEGFRFTACFNTEAEGENAVAAYRALLAENGFRQAGENQTISHLYKKVGANCYHVDTEHCFDGSMEAPDIYFDISEPYGGYDYVKPEPKKESDFASEIKEGVKEGLKNLFKF